MEYVKKQIITLVSQQRAKDAIENVGNEIIAALNEGQTSEAVVSILPEEVPASWQQQLNLGREGTEISAQLRNDVFRMTAPNDGSSVYKGTLLGTGDYAVVK